MNPSGNAISRNFEIFGIFWDVHISYSKYESYDTLEGKVRNSSSVRSQIVANRRQCSAILNNHITRPNSV